MFFLYYLAAIWSNKVIDYNVINSNSINSIDDRISNGDIYNSIILCKDLSFQTFKDIKNKNIVYTYEETLPSQYSHNFLLTLLSSRYNLPIVTTKHNYFKPFQYSINDLALLKIEEVQPITNIYESPTNETFGQFKITKEILKKNNFQFLIENEHTHLFIRTPY